VNQITTSQINLKSFVLSVEFLFQLLVVEKKIPPNILFCKIFQDPNKIFIFNVTCDLAHDVIVLPDWQLGFVKNFR
jgi:hypothetical protein